MDCVIKRVITFDAILLFRSSRFEQWSESIKWVDGQECLLHHYDHFFSTSLIDDELAIVINEKINNQSHNKQNDQNKNSMVDSEPEDLDINDENDPLIIKYNRLVKRLDRLQAVLHRLQKENDVLKRNTIGKFLCCSVCFLLNIWLIFILAIPPPDVQKWFQHVAQRFENKPLSGSVLQKFSDELNIPVNVLISLKQETGTLTARAIVRYLFPSKRRTMDDITNIVRRSILSKNHSTIVNKKAGWNVTV